MTVKLTDFQRVLLSNASQTDNRQLTTAAADGVDTTKAISAIASLVRRKLLEKVDTPDKAERLTYRVTDVGLASIGVIAEVAPPAAETATASSGPQTKTALVLNLMKRTEGATLDQMVAATGWLPHTTRAALTGLRKRGHGIARTATDYGSVYRIGAAA